MNKHTFGNSNKYKMLGYLTDNICLLPKNKKNYLSLFIERFNQKCNDLSELKHSLQFKYIISLVKKDYRDQLAELDKKYDNKLISYLRNYIYARLKILIEENDSFYKIISDDIMELKNDENIYF